MLASTLNPNKKTTSGEKYLKLDNVKKSYKRPWKKPVEVLKGINLTVNYGDKIGILGRNGAGKSTLIKLIGGVIRPTGGKIERKMSTSWPIGFGGGGFQGSLTGVDNLKFICRLYGLDWRQKLPMVEELAQLGKYLYEPVNTYSAGMKARLGFALSMVVDFDCYLIDEALAVGDARFKDKFKRELFEKRGDRSFIIVSHQQGQIKEFCNRFFVLTNGNLIEFENFGQAWKFYSRQ
jgi:capsular polysaccharide transport system ATP-binding protein